MAGKGVVVSENITTVHPFIYNRPVQPGEFLNREAELRAVFNRLRNGESTAVVGEPHIGKSSLLLQLTDEATQRAYLGDDVQRLTISWPNLHSIGSDYTPTAFWKETVEPLQKIDDDTLAQRLEQLAQANYARRPLERLFNHLGRQGRRLLLLLDEFERVLTHSNFQDPAFFALLRSLATRTGGLVLVTASRFSAVEIGKQGRGLLDIGSPLFNIMIGIRLGLFDEQTVNALLDQAGEALSPADRLFARRVAGRHPFLLQTMASTLTDSTVGSREIASVWWRKHADDTEAALCHRRHARAAEHFYEQVTSHFDDLWHTLDDRARATATVLSLIELGKRALGQSFTYDEEIRDGTAFNSELHKLAELGLAEQVDLDSPFHRKRLPCCQGKQWTVGMQAFSWWVDDVIVPAHDTWLDSDAYRFWLTPEQWRRLMSELRNIPEQSVGELAQALSEELAKGGSE